MDFTWPFMLGLLATVPVLIALYLWLQRRRRRYALRYANLSVIKEALAGGPGFRRHIPPMLFLGALAAMIVAMARPVAIVSVPASQGTVILTIDVSGSMNADDLKPSRMEAAKAAARSFVERQPDGVQIGIISFSDQVNVMQPPSADREKALAAINQLDAEGGTAIGSALKASVDTLLGASHGPALLNNPSQGGAPRSARGTLGSGIIVLLTDGENTWGPPPLEAAQEAVDQGVRVYTVGIGSANGSVLHVNGQAIRAGLDEVTLKRIAGLTGGKYYNAASEQDLRSIYENLSARLVLKTERTEITAGFTSMAAVLSLLAALASMLWFNRMPF